MKEERVKGKKVECLLMKCREWLRGSSDDLNAETVYILGISAIQIHGYADREYQ